jgi:hypothetical protein
VVIAVTVMGMVQATIDQVTGVVAMGHRFVAAAGSVNMVMVMAKGSVHRRTCVRIGRGHLKRMFINMVAMRVMQVAIVKIVHMIAVPDGRMTTARAVLMGMVFVLVASHGSVSTQKLHAQACPRPESLAANRPAIQLP